MRGHRLHLDKIIGAMKLSSKTNHNNPMKTTSAYQNCTAILFPSHANNSFLSR